MADTVFSRQLAAHEAEHAERANKRNRVIGRPWFNAMLALVLVAIGTWVYRSPIASVVAEAPLLGRASEALVSQFSGDLDKSMAEASIAPKTESAVTPPSTALPAADTTTTSTTAAPKVKLTPPSTAPKKAAPKPAPALTTSKSPQSRLLAPPLNEVINPATTYYGMAASQTPFNMSGVDSFTAMTGKAPNLVGGYQTWDNAFQPNAAVNTWRRGQLPMFTWEPMKSGETVLLADVASGKYDDYIRRYATSVRDSGVPVAIRFAHEMNGRWYPWSEGRFGNKPGDYVAAWQHVHNVFGEVGATNVVWVWSPNVVGSNRALDLAQVYPGDAYADWAGLSGYYRVDTGRTPSFNGTFKESLDAVRRVTSKRILLSEIGVGTTTENRVTWINSLFEELPKNPDVVGFVYFNYDKTTQEGSLQDWRLEFDPAVVDAFRFGVVAPKYGAGL